MIYRSTLDGMTVLPNGREVTLSRGERIDSRFWLADELAYLEERGFAFLDEDVEQATANPGQKRSTRRTAKKVEAQADDE